ncbi:thioesterase [Kitasatospora phosalacinea]|uniref:Thioesterase n=1 Tax=Kitasatospora phosalacinea TaxID=2065 RepID=A0A9W6Q6D9_9ACTN|nr:alpha/beta fold hydrolase [Kitasatospora phosalacinea]GLW70762.1 thioesterase [Kitasatospora phosalacinea]
MTGSGPRAGVDRWLPVLRPARRARRLRLVCLPYAGGSPDLFRPWADQLDHEVELLALRLPGRGVRLREPLYDSWEPLVEDVFAALVEAGVAAEPHAFFGHSFGARLAYELADRAAREFPGATRRLFVSGSRSPEHPQHRPLLHEMAPDAYLDAVRAMGGTPAEVLDDPAVMRLFLPTMRAEMRLAEIWSRPPGQPRLDVPITAMYGRDDPVDGRAATAGWRRHSLRPSELLELPGGHFFLDTHRDLLLATINARLVSTA